MKRNSMTLFLAILLLNAKAQNGYNTIPIRHDTAIQWSAECDKVLNLSPSTANGESLKKWYLGKLKNGTVTAYTKDAGSRYVSSYEVSMPQLEKQDWLKGLSSELSYSRYPNDWYFVDNTLSGYERV